MEKIRIAHVAGGLTTGGVESVVLNYFSHIDMQQYEPIYISYDTPDPKVKERFEKLGFKVYEVTKKKENLLKSCWEVYKILKENHIQIVHSHMTHMCFVSNILGCMAGAKVIISHSHLAECPAGVKKYVYGFFKFLSCITATDWFTCSRDAAICLFGRKAWNSGKVHLLSNAIDLSQFLYDEEKRKLIRAENGWEDFVVIGNVGRFTEQKNQKFVLEVFRVFHTRFPQSRMLFVGSGPEMDDIQDRVRKFGLEDAVIFTGSVMDPSIYYMAMDVFLFPSRYEGLGIAAVEAQAAMLPVLASDVVPKEAVVSDTVKFLPLTASATEWAKNLQILLTGSTRSKMDKKELHSTLQRLHYDIDQEVDWLGTYYRERLR